MKPFAGPSAPGAIVGRIQSHYVDAHVAER